jgi:hypothetical protein
MAGDRCPMIHPGREADQKKLAEKVLAARDLDKVPETGFIGLPVPDKMKRAVSFQSDRIQRI